MMKKNRENGVETLVGRTWRFRWGIESRDSILAGRELRETGAQVVAAEL